MRLLDTSGLGKSRLLLTNPFVSLFKRGEAGFVMLSVDLKARSLFYFST